MNQDGRAIDTTPTTVPLGDKPPRAPTARESAAGGRRARPRITRPRITRPRKKCPRFESCNSTAVELSAVELSAVELSAVELSALDAVEFKVIYIESLGPRIQMSSGIQTSAEQWRLQTEAGSFD